jgi:cytochrome c oxidase assembly protein subunit 11
VLSFVIGMVGMAYAAVPLYDMFCKITGYGGTTQRVEQASDKSSSTARSPCVSTPMCRAACLGLRAGARDVELKIGETVQIITRRARTSSTPTRAGDLQRHAAGRRRLFQQGRVLLLHRHDA